MSDEVVEISNGIETVQKRQLLQITNVMKDVINPEEFAGIMLIYQRAIKRIEKERGKEI